MFKNTNSDIKRFDELFVSKSHRLNRRNIIVVCSLVFVAIFILIIVLVFTSCPWFDSASLEGSYRGKSEEQIKADLNAQVQDGEMNVSIANIIKFPNGSLNDGIAHIENIKANHVDQKVSIALLDDNCNVYESGAIAPNHCINNIRLNKKLEAGEYKAIATFKGFDIDTHNEVGSISAQISLLVY